MSSDDAYRYGKQWRLDRQRGQASRYVATAPITAHLERLRASGMTLDTMSELGGCGKSTLHQILYSRQDRTQARTARTLLAIQLAPADPSGFVNRAGTERRIKALLTLGWRHEDIKAASGITTHLILTHPGHLVTGATAAAVAIAYRRLSVKQGPSQRTRDRAARSGHHGPLAWESIDDPGCEPEGGEADASARPDAIVEDVRWLLDQGERPEHLHERFGVTRAYLRSTALERDPDLHARLTAA